MSEEQVTREIVVRALFLGTALHDVSLPEGSTVDTLINKEGLSQALLGDGISIRVNGTPATRNTVLENGNTVTISQGKVQAA